MIKGRKVLRVVGVLGLLAVLLLNTTPVYAQTADPDSTPTIDSINMYRNLLETGDWLVLIYANIPYATPPSTPVNETFIWSLVDSDNVTELGSTVGYAYNVGTHDDDGFGYNLWSMYFTAANVTSLGMVWGTTSYSARLAGNPAVFHTPPIYNYGITSGDYSTLTAMADVQAELAARILTIADELDNRWGLTTAFSLLTQNETATVLSVYGEAFFRGAIHGLQAFAPSVFSVVIRIIDIDPRTWTDNYTTNLTGQWSGTWAETAREAGRVLFGTTYDLLSIILLLIMAVGLLIGNVMLTGDHWNGWIDVAVLSVIAARLGMYDLAFLILMTSLCWLYISMKLWFGLIK